MIKKNNFNVLTKISKPYVHLLSSKEEDFEDFFWKIRSKYVKFVVRILRGKRDRASDKGRFFQEIAAAMQLPDYFGHNWDALDECLDDLEWLPGDGYIILVSQIELFFPKSEEDYATLITLLDSNAKSWMFTKGPDEHFPREPKPFHIVFQCEPDKFKEVKERLLKTGVEFDEL